MLSAGCNCALLPVPIASRLLIRHQGRLTYVEPAQVLRRVDVPELRVQVPVYVAGPGICVAGPGADDNALEHVGGPQDWTVSCPCGVTDDDGERMLACDSCGHWFHHLCCGIPCGPEDPDPEQFVCPNCRRSEATALAGTADAQMAAGPAGAAAVMPLCPVAPVQIDQAAVAQEAPAAAAAGADGPRRAPPARPGADAGAGGAACAPAEQVARVHPGHHPAVPANAVQQEQPTCAGSAAVAAGAGAEAPAAHPVSRDLFPPGQATAPETNGADAMHAACHGAASEGKQAQQQVEYDGVQLARRNADGAGPAADGARVLRNGVMGD